MPCRTQHSRSQGGPRGTPPAPGSRVEGQTVQCITGVGGSCRGALALPRFLSRTDWHLHLGHAYTQRGLTAAFTRARSRPSHIRTRVFMSPTLFRSQPDAHVCVRAGKSPTATHPQACVIVAGTIPGAQTSLCPPTNIPTQTPCGITQVPPAPTTTDGPWHPGASSPVQPGHFPPNSPGPWAAGPARQRWTGAGTGSGCGLPASPASGSSRCPSPLSWHLLGPGRGGMSPRLARQSHPQCRPLPKKR